MIIELNNSDFSEAEVVDAVNLALKNELSQANSRRDHFAQICTKLESEHQLSSDEFMIQFENGELGDDVVYFDWFAAKRGYDLWTRRMLILSGIQL